MYCSIYNRNRIKNMIGRGKPALLPRDLACNILDHSNPKQRLVCARWGTYQQAPETLYPWDCAPAIHFPNPGSLPRGHQHPHEYSFTTMVASGHLFKFHSRAHLSRAYNHFTHLAHCPLTLMIAVVLIAVKYT